jgi:uncharacterized membrane protein
MERAKISFWLILIGILGLIVHMNGCATGGQTGALAGGGMGALVGQAIGHDTEATLIGAAVGTGVGYIIGNERDKKKAREMSQASRASEYAHEQVGPFGGTRWKVVDISPPGGPIPPFTSKIIEFGQNGQVQSITTYSDGTVDVQKERYRVVDNVLIINKPGYLINATYRINGTHGNRTLDLYTNDFHAALIQIP